ncbi:hypothetical protein L907_25075 [Agrobacterium sp. C13]|nr:hypothetical protein L903_25550 [Agrobacterium sp. JL28]KVK59087.1 hypothetical protein L906_25460 [Agrobacterium sp. TS45]KVK63488.1 hypothetical protein L907_25075 [Agrobacterium sp. C13]
MIHRHVSRNALHRSGDFRRRFLIEGGKAQVGRLTEVDLVDILRRDLGLHHQLVDFRHDHHDLLARRHDAADGVH